MSKRYLLSLLVWCLPGALFAEPKVGQALPLVKISGDLGGKVDGTAWNSQVLAGKVRVIFYVDPDEKDINEDMENALKAQKFPDAKYGSVGIINMDATWMPNFAIESALESKQEKFPHVMYVRDKDKVLVKKWGLKDDTYVTLALDKNMKVLFYTTGKVGKKQIARLIEVVKANL